jgi:predicted transcriptional regulator
MAGTMPREEVRRLLDSLPDDASYEDIQYHIYVQQKIDRGLEAAERGDFVSDEEIERRIARWGWRVRWTMKVMTARVVDGKIDVGDAELQEGAAVAVLISEGSDFQLSYSEEEELELALAEIRHGDYTDGRALLQELKGPDELIVVQDCFSTW